MRSSLDFQHGDLTGRIIKAAVAIHRKWGPGLLESAYRNALHVELRHMGVRIRKEAPVSLEHRGELIGPAFRADLIVEEQVIVEVKAVEKLAPVHARQLITYLKATGLEVGLLLNFGASSMREGVTRVVNSL
ncbi:MAG: GxxExxY protein [Planctomycetota bacterium]